MSNRTAKGSEFGAVQPDNLRTGRPARGRRDPDVEGTPPPAAPAVQPHPAPGPGPTDPSPPPAPTQPGVAAVSPADGGTLASVLTAPHHQRHQVSEGVAALAGLAALATRPVDPMQDWAGDGTRTPRWIIAAVKQYAQLQGRKVQEVHRDALLGVRPIPEDVLDAAWLNHYGYPRDRYDPQAYT